MSFLSQVADHLVYNYADNMGDVTVVFPNRRSGLFLKKHLAKKIDQPIWSPNTLSLEDFLFQFSSIKKTDPLTLIFELYEAFRLHQPADGEGFESFYFWGEMLLKDFEEVDHYLVKPDQLFHYIKSHRQIAEDFYFLDEHHEQLIQKFWQDFFPTASKSQEQFMETWQILAPTYTSFKERLDEKGFGYTSHIYRDLVDHISDKVIPENTPIVFAGFNALTPAEEFLIKHFVQEAGADVLWDIDSYYLSDEIQEAGAFLRNYQKDVVLGATFPREVPSKVNDSKKVQVTGVSLEVGQAKAIGEQVEELMASGVAPEEIVVILPQEHMLFPVLNAIPPCVEKLNVTMGYPLKETPLFGLLEAALEVQEHKQLSPENGLSFYYKPTLDVLSHPYLYQSEKAPLDTLTKAIKQNNQIRVFHQDILEVGSTVLNTVFRNVGEQESYASYLLSIVEVLGQQVVERFGLEKEFLYHFQQLLSRLDEIIGSQQSAAIDLKTFGALFKKTTRSVKIPFSGEPVEGLQIMGVLETRNLDFSHVLMLNMNEGVFPASQRTGSFIPYSIRKAFDLPTFEVQDAIYAYLFYRLFHASQQLSFYYNMYADFGMSGEVSRFIRQLEQESNLLIERKKLSNSIQVQENEPISIVKSERVLSRLMIYTDTVSQREQKRLSASAINTYLNCKLQFYFRYVLRIFSSDELSDELDKRNFGNVLHATLEYLYRDAIAGKEDKRIDGNDFFRLQNSVEGAIEKAFRKHFGMGDKRKFELKDRNLVMADVIRKFADQILKMDEKYAPFSIVSMEKDDRYEHLLTIHPDGRTIRVRLGADIDRVDQKNGVVRVIDYKTGKDEREINEVSSVFDVSSPQAKKKRNKAGFQTLLYAWLYAASRGEEHAIVPGLMNMQELFHPKFDYRLTMGGKSMTDARPFLTEFESHLSALLSEIFSEEQVFDQTEDVGMCKYCDFKGICGR